METKLNIVAIYKDENNSKVIYENEGKYYEVLLTSDSYDDRICINGRCISLDRDITTEEFKHLLIAGAETLRELFDSKNSRLRAKVILCSKNRDEIYHEFMNIKQKPANYEDVMVVPYVDEVDTDKTKMYQMLLSPIFSTDNASFIKEYETEYLRNHRFYQKQRNNYMPWDEYFMAIAKLTSLRSKDPSTQVGACIVGDDNRILSIGYNGAPIGIDDDYFPWERTGENLHTKYMYVCHAEMNAILNYRGSRKDFEGATVYVDLFPCNECAKLIIQAGIKKIVYLSDKYANTDSTIASKRMFDAAGVEYAALNPEYQETITLSLNPKDK